MMFRSKKTVNPAPGTGSHQQHRLGTDSLAASLWKSAWGSWWMASWAWASCVSWQQRWQQHPGLDEQEQRLEDEQRIIPQQFTLISLYLKTVFSFGSCTTGKITEGGKMRGVLLEWLRMEHWPAEEKMGDLGIFSLEKGFLWRQLITDPQCL